jgi:hypothetical protein
MPPNYDIVPSEAIELLAPGDDGESGKHRRHIRSVSSSSFVHFKSPQIQQEEEETHKITNVNQLASQVNK